MRRVFNLLLNIEAVQWEAVGCWAIFNKDEPQAQGLPRAQRVVAAGGLSFSYAPALK